MYNYLCPLLLFLFFLLIVNVQKNYLRHDFWNKISFNISFNFLKTITLLINTTFQVSNVSPFVVCQTVRKSCLKYVQLHFTKQTRRKILQIFKLDLKYVKYKNQNNLILEVFYQLMMLFLCVFKWLMI
jgi:hypothetical protein